MFNWSNRMIGSEDPEYQTDEEVAQQAAMELYAYASELFAAKRIDPHDDLMSVLTEVDMEGEKLNSTSSWSCSSCCSPWPATRPPAI